MLEKIGLPAKPSLRGSNWVVDASHCQGCSSQFSFINRKHHCRRCGGLFCNSCTQNRMILRGQGDSPVRICEPCKKLEEAARFEMRHGHKSRAGRGSSKLTAKYEDDALIQILGTDGKDSFFSARESTTDTASEFQGSMSSASCSSLHVEAQHGEGYIPRSPSIDALNQILSESVSISPEKLRHQALEEKKKYRILKAEGKPEEALKAFKKGKELEREAEAVEVALRKSRRKALSSSSVENMHQIEDDRKEACRKRKPSSQIGKEEKDDLAAELRELGWADTDLHKDDTKPASLSLEGELSSLLGEVPRKPNPGAGTGGSDRSQVLTLKKKALMLKREGKLAEAKEELKRAKILEKQLEEQEFLAEAEDSDDELSALIRSMDDDKQDDFYQQETDFDFDHPVGFSDDLGVDSNFEVTDEDMDDPEISAALKSLGWTEDADHLEKSVPPVPKDREAILDEILSLKREAVYQKRAGNAVEAMAQLKKAKLLERDLESLQSQENSLNALNPTMQKDLVSQTGEKSSKLINMDNVDCGVVPRSKIVIQKELLSLKKKALALRREGRLDEAEEELNKGKVLERQLEEMENSSKVKPRKMTDANRESKQPYKHSDVSGTPPLGDEVVDGDVTDQDMNDPAMLSLLKNLGWEDEDIEPAPSKPFKQMGNRSVLIDSATQGFSSSPFVEPRKSKSEIQRELLVLKRKALALRRQGESEEAEEVLRMTKVLEGQMAEIEAQKKGVLVDSKDEFDGLGSLLPQQKEENSYSVHETEIINPPISSSMEKRAEGGEVTENVMHDPPALLVLGSTSIGMTTEPSKEMSSQSLLASDALGNQTASGTSAVASGKNKAGIQRELLGLKRKALALRRQGETEEAEEVLKMAKVLEAEMEEMEVPKKEFLSDSTVHRELDSFQSLVSHDKHGNMKYVDESNRGTLLAVELKEEVAEKSMVPDWKGSNVAKSFPWSSADLIPGISHLIGDKNSLNASLDPPPDKKTGEATSSLPLSGQSVPVTDLLTGDDWKSSQLPVHELEDKGNIGLNIPSIADSIQRGTSETLDREWGSRNELRSDKSEKTALAIQKSTHEVNSYPVSESHKQQSSLKQEILDRKRKAVSLKREGKLGEAREELRQAKILEKRPDENPQPSTVLIDACASKPNVTYVGQKVQKATDQASRPMPGRDRFKLQQESLAHKRKALKLRREGRMEEAEAEFQLAKDLETQLEEAGHDLLSSNKNISEAEAMNDVGVEDLLDPQLMSALKAIGLQHADTVSHPPQRTEASRANISNSDKSNQEISQLEDRIKAEKVKAINLKRAGKQSEALDALRHAKQLEKKLNSLTSK